MKITWEASDITVGRHVRQIGCNETWMIGYYPSDPIECRMALISLIDGMICTQRNSRETVCAQLNEGKYFPAEMLDERGYLKHTV